MITKSPAEPLQSRDPPSGARRREMRQYVRVRPVAVPRVRRGGDTYALDWRSDPHLLAILARTARRERRAREEGQSRWRRAESNTEAHSHPQEVHRDADAVRSVPRV
jgi:hypothetical protein